MRHSHVLLVHEGEGVEALVRLSAAQCQEKSILCRVHCQATTVTEAARLSDQAECLSRLAQQALSAVLNLPLDLLQGRTPVP